MNIAILAGQVGQNPTTNKLQSGMTVTTFSLATTERFTKNGNLEERTTLHNVEVWGKQAETCARYLSKGSEVSVSGRISNEVYEKAGQKRRFSKVVADRVEFTQAAATQPDGATPAELN